MNSTERWQFRIDRSDIRRADLVDVPAQELADGQIELRLRRFSLTANNMTYALLGNSYVMAMAAPGYFEFFPTSEGKGLLPVWGIAEVCASCCDEVPVGTQVFGFLPLASHWALTPGEVSRRSFADVTQHRGNMPSVYSHYTIVDEGSDFDAGDSHLWVVFRPLLRTGYLIADQLRSQHYHAAVDIVVLSASTKTAMIFAHCLRRMDGAPRLVGLTSADNKAFVDATELYDKTLAYSDIDSLKTDHTAVLVDLAGDGELTRRVHELFGDNLRHSLMVGKSHWNAPRPGKPIPGPKPEMFFAPAVIAERVEEWGLDEVRRRFGRAWNSFLPAARRFIEVHIGHGKHNVPAVYQLLRRGGLNPRNPQVIEID